jgi:hypothetical protein
MTWQTGGYGEEVAIRTIIYVSNSLSNRHFFPFVPIE